MILANRKSIYICIMYYARCMLCLCTVVNEERLSAGSMVCVCVRVCMHARVRTRACVYVHNIAVPRHQVEQFHNCDEEIDAANLLLSAISTDSISMHVFLISISR